MMVLFKKKKKHEEEQPKTEKPEETETDTQTINITPTTPITIKDEKGKDVFTLNTTTEKLLFEILMTLKTIQDDNNKEA